MLMTTLGLVVSAATAAAESARNTDAPASPDAPATRPRLGLVLSGGGARGAAHIGVLQVLEQLRVPVDLVTGTSMGSVVGGLYASGLSPEDLSRVIQAIDWVDVFEDKPARQDLSFRRKQDDRGFLTGARLGFKDWTIFIPSGLVEGQKLDFLLRTLSMTSDGLARIESLPLPFRAVATNIETGEAFVFDRGELAVAQRASMSIPGAFSPVEVDGELLVDGFVANNLPIDVAQELGAEVVIAVDIATPIASRAALADAVAITGQVSGFPVQASQRKQIERLGGDDVLLQPPLGDLGSAAFTRMDEAIEIGRQAALAAAPALARYAVSESEYEAWRAAHRRPEFQPPVIDAIRLENRSPLADRTIAARIRTRAGEALDLEQLSDDLSRLYGLDAFERVRFDLRREGGSMILVYEIDPRDRGPHSFRFGLALETVFGDEANFNLGMNHVWYPINAWAGELRTQLQFGDLSRVTSSFYQPLDPAEWLFVLPTVDYSYRDVDLYVDGDRVARFDIEVATADVVGGVNLGKFGQLRGGIGYADGHARRKVGDPSLVRRRSFRGGFGIASLEVDTLDDPRFPTDGAYLRVDSFFYRRALGFDENYDRLESRAAAFYTYRKNTLGIRLRYDTSFEVDDRVTAINTLGGFLNLSGFERDSITGRHVGLLGVSLYRRVATPSVFAWRFPVYVGAIYEVGNAWDRRADLADDLRHSAAPFFAADTPLGPLYVAYAYGEGGEHQGYLYLGASF